MADNQDITLAPVEVTAPRLTYTQIDGPYGKEKVPVQDLPKVASPVANVVNPDVPVVLNDAALSDNARFKQAQLARADTAAFPESTVFDTVVAATTSWHTTKLLNRWARPDFSNEVPINTFEALEHLPIVLSEDEREYYTSFVKGVDSSNYAMKQITLGRQSSSILGDHEVTGLLASLGDPIWLAVPPAIRVGKTSATTGRALSGVTSAGIAGTITALGEGPVSDYEIATNMMMFGAIGAAMHKPGKGLVPKDVEFPKEALDEAIAGTKFKDVPVTDDTGKPTGETQTKREYPDLGPEFHANAPVLAERPKVAAAVEKAIDADAKSRGLGDKLQHNMRKEMAGYGPVGRELSELIFDNNSDFSVTSLESHHAGVLNELRAPLLDAGDLIRAEMAKLGSGTLQMNLPNTAGKAMRTQRSIELQVQREMFRREQYARLGKDIKLDAPAKPILDIADKLEEVHVKSLNEMQGAGVAGADLLDRAPGYLTRKWNSVSIDAAKSKFKALGLTDTEALSKLHKLVGLSIRLANKIEANTANQIGAAIVDRALRRGYFEDIGFIVPAGQGQIKQLLDVLKGDLDDAALDRALNIFRISADDAGKAGYLKRRMDLDYKASVRVGNDSISVMDLIDSNVYSNTDKYIRQVSTNVAFARKGLKTTSDVEALRERLSHSIPDERVRLKAVTLFDNTMDYLRGNPTGANIHEGFRLLFGYGRAITLAMSSLWQITDYSTIQAKYTMRKTLKYAIQEIPGLGMLMGGSKHEAGMLNTVLAEHSQQSMRMRPFLNKFEDGYEVDTNSAVHLASQGWGDTLMMANGMKYVHHHQARVVGNLILDRVDAAARGDVKARASLEQYGLEAPVMDRLAAEIKQHGYKVDNWNSDVWANVRPTFTKMMDEAVLKERLGDMPSWAKYDTVGKFITMYRSFVFIAHNKVMAGTVARDGGAALGLILLYQLPLTMLAVQAKNKLEGGKDLSSDELIKQSLGQMGGVGLFSEPFKWMTGQTNSVGSPGTIPLDRAGSLLKHGSNGDVNGTASAALHLVPVIIANPFINGMAKQIKE